VIRRRQSLHWLTPKSAITLFWRRRARGILVGFALADIERTAFGIEVRQDQGVAELFIPASVVVKNQRVIKLKISDFSVGSRFYPDLTL
jgi:hypothetical protein